MRSTCVTRITYAAGIVLQCAAVCSAIGSVPAAIEHRAPAMLALPFVANSGQHSSTVAFAARSPVGTTFVTREAALVHVLVPSRPGSARSGAAPMAADDGGARGWSLVERFVGGDSQRARGALHAALPISAVDRSGTVVTVPTFSTVELPRLYPGIDLTLVHGDAGIERVYRVRPGGEPKQIRIALEGTTRLSVAADGRLLIDTPLGALAQSRPVAWQETPRGRVQVAVRYRMDGDRYGFELARFDRSKSLYIDPVLATTYVGGSANDEAGAVAVDPATGDVYTLGNTDSTDFPGIAGGAVTVTNGGIFVARFDATLRTLLQATLLPAKGATGGSARGRTLAIHPVTGDVYVIGLSSGSFPGVATCSTDVVFIARLTANLRSLLGATCYSQGSFPQHSLGAIAIGPGGDVYLSATGYQFGGGDSGPQLLVFLNPFIVRYRSDLALKTGLYGGGGGAIAIHPATGELYALSASSGFGVTRLAPSLALLGSFSGDLGSFGSLSDIALHPANGQVYVVGYSGGGGPGTAGGAQPGPAGGFDAFVSRLTPDLAAILQSTYVGGSLDDLGIALTIETATGDVFVTGTTRSTDFPGTAAGAQTVPGGGIDGFVARLSPSLTIQRQTTYYGGNNDDRPTAIAIHPASGELIITGSTKSPDLPAASGSAQPALRGASDGFLARITATLSAAGGMSLVGGSGQRTLVGHAFATPLSVRIVDVNGQPVAGVLVTFALPATGASATFVGGGATASVVSRADGVAISPAVVANSSVGAFVATANTPGGVTVAFQLANDAFAIEVTTWNPAAYMLTVFGLFALAALRLRRRA